MMELVDVAKISAAGRRPSGSGWATDFARQSRPAADE
jgi:hypothetical protein